MSKITVKHYLNTTVLPSLIDDNLKYKIYFKLSYNRITTQFKSSEFKKEYYTIDEYTAFADTDDCTKRTELEQQVIKNVVLAQLKMIGTNELDRKLFASLFAYSNNPLLVLMPYHTTGSANIGANGVRTDIRHTDKEPNTEIGIKVREIMCEKQRNETNPEILKENRFYNENTIFDYFTDNEQKRVSKALIKNDIDIDISDLNMYIISRLIWFLISQKNLNKIFGIKTPIEYEPYCTTFTEKFNV